jgi:hypothetical protein
VSDQHTLTRREALRHVTALMGGVALTGGSALLSTVISADAQARATLAMTSAFSAADIAWLDEMTDTLLPETDTPGARAAAVGAFLALAVTDTYEPAEQAVFREGMRAMESHAHSTFGAGLQDLPAAERLAVLEHFDAAQIDWHEAHKDADPKVLPHFFRMMKELSLLGYFTSQVGATQALRYIESPGRFDPCYPYKAGDRNWAPG